MSRPCRWMRTGWTCAGLTAWPTRGAVVSPGLVFILVILVIALSGPSLRGESPRGSYAPVGVPDTRQSVSPGLAMHPAIAASQYRGPELSPVMSAAAPPELREGTPRPVGEGFVPASAGPRYGSAVLPSAGTLEPPPVAASRVRVVQVSGDPFHAIGRAGVPSSGSGPFRMTAEGDVIVSAPRGGAGPGQEMAASPSHAIEGPVPGITHHGSVHRWPEDVDVSLGSPSAQLRQKLGQLIEEVQDPEAFLQLDPRRSKLIRTRIPVSQFSITHPDILDVVQYSPTEFELIGTKEGQTTLTLWFGQQVLRYLIRVARDTQADDLAGIEYGNLQRKLHEMFPNSMIQLIPFADKLIVRGQAKDAREAAQILAILGQQRIDQTGRHLGPGSYVNVGTAARPYLGADDLPTSNIINMIDVPHEQQVMLKVRVAEMSRSAVREIGSRLAVSDGNFGLNAPFGLGDNVFQAILNSKEVYYAFQAVSSNSYSKILAEPNLVTLNGQPASFIAGGEFAVPTFVGVGNETGLSTTFRGFGTQLTFTPTIIGKDLIRLVVSPSFTQPNNGLSVGDIPGLDSRAVTTTVNLREGQWLAIAGLIQDEQSGNKLRAPVLGDIPILDLFFSKRKITRGETELVVLVSPEIVRPLECEQAPLVLPGMEVTEPNDWDFFLFGYYEGRPGCDHRSTVWPIQQQRVVEGYRGNVRQVKQQTSFQKSETYYTYGRIGFSD